MKRHLRAAGILLSVASLVAVVGLVGAGSPAGAAGTDTALITEGSTRTARVEEARIALEYPSQWVPTAVTIKQAREIIRRLRKSNPRLAKMLSEDDLLESTKNSKFRAVDVKAQLEKGVGGVVEVQVLPASLPPIEIFRSSYGSGLKAGGGELIGVEETRVSHRDALRSDARLTLADPDGTPITLRVSQLLIDQGLTTAMVNVGVPDDENADATIEAILSTVRRL